MSYTVLIVEDETILARNLARTLTRLGIDVVQAHTYTDALAELGQRHFDLLCLDIQLGDGNGLDLAEAMQLVSAPVPVIIMTGQDSVPYRARAEHLNVVAFLGKPFALAQFRELVSSLLLDHKRDDELECSQREGPCVLMYSHDTIGLGHMRRNTAIAAALVQRVPGISVLLLVGCPAGVVFDVPKGADVIKLPSVAKLARERWRPGSLRIGARQLRELRKGLIERTIEGFRPDVIVVDHEPTGVWDELKSACADQLDGADRPRWVLGIRDILDSPDVIRKRWRQSGVDTFIASHYDSVLIYGDQAVYPSASEYGIDEMDNVRHEYVGYVVSERHADADNVIARTSDRAHVLVTGGGGRDAYPMMDALLRAMSDIPPAKRPDMTVVAGPLMDAELAEQVKIRASELALNYLNSSDSLADLMQHADLLITMGGYNSMSEAIVNGVPIVVVPRVGPSAEQRLRAALFEKLNLVRQVSMSSELSNDLKQQLLHVRPRMQHAWPRLNVRFNGAQQAAAAIETLLQKPESTVGKPLKKHEAYV